MTVPIPASAEDEESVKYEQNDSIAGTLLHSTCQVNHHAPAANAEGQLFCSLRHQSSAKRVAAGNTYLDFSFAVTDENRRERLMAYAYFPFPQISWEKGISPLCIA